MPELETAYERGRRFHRWVERYFLGLPVPDGNDADPVLLEWWATFRHKAPAIPAGLRFVETSVTVPVGRHFLTGRFDLLVVSENEDRTPSARLFDWKTGEPRTVQRLENAWQTRVYLAVLTEGAAALLHEPKSDPAPDHITMTYWYLEDPERPRTIHYNTDRHARNWADLTAMVAEVDERLASDDWPLTDDWSLCRHCAYRAYCDRMTAGEGLPDIDDEAEDEFDPADDWLEPQWG